MTTDRDAVAEEAAVRAVLDAMVAAWDAGDGAAYGGHFTVDASYVTFVGTIYRGSAEIGSAHSVLFGKFLKGTRLAYELQEIRFPTSDVAIVTTHGDTYKTGKAPKLAKVQTYTLIRSSDGSWLVAAFHNTQRRPIMEGISFRLAPGTIPAAAR